MELNGLASWSYTCTISIWKQFLNFMDIWEGAVRSWKAVGVPRERLHLPAHALTFDSWDCCIVFCSQTSAEGNAAASSRWEFSLKHAVLWSRRQALCLVIRRSGLCRSLAPVTATSSNWFFLYCSHFVILTKNSTVIYSQIWHLACFGFPTRSGCHDGTGL